jgi:hypothetical protein
VVNIWAYQKAFLLLGRGVCCSDCDSQKQCHWMTLKWTYTCNTIFRHVREGRGSHFPNDVFLLHICLGGPLLFFDRTGIWTQGFALAKQALYHLSPFFSGYFGDGVLWTISSDWPWTTILLISASQVARITGLSHGCLCGESSWTWSEMLQADTHSVLLDIFLLWSGNSTPAGHLPFSRH